MELKEDGGIFVIKRGGYESRYNNTGHLFPHPYYIREIL